MLVWHQETRSLKTDKCSVKWTTDFTKVTKVRHGKQGEKQDGSKRFFIKMENETEDNIIVFE